MKRKWHTYSLSWNNYFFFSWIGYDLNAFQNVTVCCYCRLILPSRQNKLSVAWNHQFKTVAQLSVIQMFSISGLQLYFCSVRQSWGSTEITFFQIWLYYSNFPVWKAADCSIAPIFWDCSFFVLLKPFFVDPRVKDLSHCHQTIFFTFYYHKRERNYKAESRKRAFAPIFLEDVYVPCPDNISWEKNSTPPHLP